MGVKCGIYCIENRLNHKKYIGQSIDISRRWMQHKQQNMIARDTFLYNAIKKYGIESFDFYILEECNEEILNEREMFWIEYYDTFQNGYNMTIGGAGTNTGERHHLQNILPKNLVRHFVRGFVDGDGWVGIGTQPSGARFSRLNITCASIDFLNDLVDTMGWEHRAIHSKQNSKAV